MIKNNIGLFNIPENIIEDTIRYKESLDRYLDKKYNEVEFRAKRVPMGIYEQRTTGKFMVRVRIPAGVVLIPQILKIAELSKKFGDGIVHITTRQDMQIHSVDIESTPIILDELLEVGLSPRGGGGNTVRNITTCPMAGLCPYEEFDVTPYAGALTWLLISDESSFNLPRKFKIGFSGCSKDCGFVSVADCGFFAHRTSGAIRFSVYAGGGLGPHARTGIKIEDSINVNELYLVAESVKRVFDKYGDRRNKHTARLRYVLERIGEERFVEEYKKEFEKLKSNGNEVIEEEFIKNFNIPLPQSIQENIISPSENRSVLNRISQATPGRNGWSPLNPEEFPSSVRKYLRLLFKERFRDRYSFMLILKNGNIHSEKLVELAKIAEKYGYNFLRTTQLQNIMVSGILYDDLPNFVEEIERLGIPISSYSGIDIVSCAGASTCKLGLCLSRGLATQISELVDDGPADARNTFSIRISGCPNGCGHHHIGDIGLQGGARRIKSNLMPFYEVFIGANIHEGRASLAHSIGSLPAKAIPDFLKLIIKQEKFLEPEVAKNILSSFWVELNNIYPDGNFPQDYYVDFGAYEKFSLAGRGPGECGAGVLDVVKLDIDNSKSFISEAKRLTDINRKNEAIYNAILSAARSLLVLYGEEPEKDFEVFTLFKKYLVEKGWVQIEAENVISKAIEYKMGELDSLETEIDKCERIITRVEELFYSLDSNLQFNISIINNEKEISRGKEIKKERLNIKEQEPSLKVDLRGVKCPMNFVKTKLALDKIQEGEICEIVLDEGEPIDNVPLSIKELGHEIIEKKKRENYYILKVLKK